jgi:filamentous hemagglutinin family protein
VARGTYRLRALMLAGTALVCVGAGFALAGPNGGTVVGGSGSISGQGSSSVTVNQSSQNLIVNWTTFNIGKGETTTFNQPNSTSTALNRVIGGMGPSFIDGTLTANGRVFIVNGDGILIGPNGAITTSGFLATTHDIRNDDFMAGKYNFTIPGNPSASVVNLGNITATSGGFAALVAPGVRNSGTITATLGTVSLTAGNSFTLDFYGDKLITLAVNDQIASAVKDVQTGQTLKSLVSNTGKLSANGGRVQLTAAAARAIVDSVINNKGVIEANSVGTKNGLIVLSAATGKSKPASAPTQTIKLSGTISASGKTKGSTGGTVVVSGENIVLASANIDASGDAGGGHVLIGGDTGGGNPSAAAATIELAKLESFVISTATTVSVDGASTINASATGSGNAGKVVLWSDQQTNFAGTIRAQGGPYGGDGGFVETSSGGQVSFNGAVVNTLAPAGTTGTWLVDPRDLTIDAEDAATLNSVLATTSVILQTTANGPPTGPANTFDAGPGAAGDIIVNAPITWSSNSTLTLSAYNDVLVNALIKNAKSESYANGNLVLRADNTGKGSGTVVFGCDPCMDFSRSNGTVSLYYNPVAYDQPTNYSQDVRTSFSNQFTPYMLVPVHADSETKVYGNSDPTLGYTVSGVDTSILQFSGALSRATGENVGAYDISQGTLSLVSGLEGQKYLMIFFSDSSLSITSRPITVTADALSTAYGHSIPTLTYVVGSSGLANGDTLTGSLATTATTTSNVGQYPISQGTLAASSNYALTYVGANLTISQAPLTVTANSQSMFYGNAVPSLTYVVAGLENGDTLTGALATAATTTSNVGQYAITQGTLAATPNYAVTYVAANLTVIPRPLTITANPQSVSFGTAIPPLTYSIGGLGLVNGDTLTGSLATTATSSSPPGSYAITLGTLGNPNYALALNSGQLNYAITYFGAALTVVPAPVQTASPPQLLNQFGNPVELTSLGKGHVVDTQALNRPRVPPPPPPPGGAGSLPPEFGPKFFVPPPIGETHLVQKEVVLQVSNNIPLPKLQALLAGLGMSITSSQSLGLLGVTTFQVHINNGQSIAAAIMALSKQQNIVAGAQANYTWQLTQAQPPDLAGLTQGVGDAGQYIIGKLGLVDIHRQLKGSNISIAVIDSQIDVKHPDLEGDIAEQFDAVGMPDQPHSHGTGMAGAIASHRRLMGIAPSARIYAIHAFSSGAASSESTTFNILKGLEWAAEKGVRVINMSFAGPRDPSMERALRAAHDKGIVLIAAAGNAGPKSPPLYPGADPNVIAVTATDVNDKLFNGANRGKYIAVAAPGVDILVPAPNNAYQVTTGTSVASAEVSGIAALLLERNPNLGPEDVRKILTESAHRLGKGDRDDDFGWGLVDPSKAIQTAGDYQPLDIATDTLLARPAPVKPTGAPVGSIRTPGLTSTHSSPARTRPH